MKRVVVVVEPSGPKDGVVSGSIRFKEWLAFSSRCEANENCLVECSRGSVIHELVLGWDWVLYVC